MSRSNTATPCREISVVNVARKGLLETFALFPVASLNYKQNKFP